MSIAQHSWKIYSSVKKSISSAQMASVVEAIAHKHKFSRNEQIKLVLGGGIKVLLALEIQLQQVSNWFTLVKSLVVNGSNGYYGFSVATVPRGNVFICLRHLKNRRTQRWAEALKPPLKCPIWLVSISNRNKTRSLAWNLNELLFYSFSL